MKRMSLLFVLLLTAIGVAANAMPGDPTSIPLPTLAAAPAMTPVAPPACDAKSQSLPQVIPAFLENVGGQTCGTCSDAKCQGATLHQVCQGSPSGSYHCENVLGNFCSGIIPQCTCWTGPLP